MMTRYADRIPFPILYTESPMPPPTTIMLIRHAEKELSANPDVAGVDINGQSDKHSLVPRGWQRAGALVPFFFAPWRAGIERPTIIFAADRTEASNVKPEQGKSRRPVETVTPLRERLGDRARSVQIPVDDLDGLASAILASDGVVLVCWEHHRIPAIAAHFVENPPSWADNVFDAVWVLARAENGYELRVVQQDLLSGDQPAA